MSKKQIQTLLVIFVVLVAGILIRHKQAHRGVVTEDFSALSFAFDETRAAKVVFAKSQTPEFTLVKESSGWVLPELWNAKAADEKIKTLLSGLASVRGELRADDETLLGDFGISDESALGIQIFDAQGAVLADLKVGSQRAGSNSIFIRRSANTAVYYADLDLFRQLGLYGKEITAALEPRLWADLEPLDLTASNIRSIEVLRPMDGALVQAGHVSKTDSDKPEWKFENSYEGFKIDPQQVEAYVRAIANIRASTVVDPAGAYGFETPALEIKIGLAEKTVAVIFGQENSDQKTRMMQVEGDPLIYEVSKFTYQDVWADDSRFFQKGYPGLDHGAVEKISLMQQGKTKVIDTADQTAFNSIQGVLQGLSYEGLLLTDREKKKARSPGLDSVTLQFKDGESSVLDIGESFEGSQAKDTRFAAQVRGSGVLFSISESDYKALFEAMAVDDSALPPAETNTSQPASNKAE